ncbi:hypothetical protein B7P43_G00509 [Cryptotermes secundus]|uniref:Chemosensory protein n=1 Tax=Cryptotermes secundus TaxID=105785 RepID=A0A2J7R651_9NEOP|nr:general odorant-binding protein 68 [Cryptotermes secundus]PNF36308.1 hypothetical protein B7P43_G00509 [Cryptotermes secundus]
MTSSPLLVCLSLICATVTGLSLQGFQSVDSVLSALSRLEDKAFLAKQRELHIPSLEEDLEEFVETSSLSRFKRNAMDKHRLYPKCCGSVDKPDFTQETRKLFEECKAKMNESSEHKGAQACGIAECIGREKGALDEDGYAKEEDFEKFIDEAYTDDTLKDVAKHAGLYCAKKANKRAREIMSEGLVESNCNLAGIMAYHCVKYEVILNCPESQTVHSEECDDFRQMMQEWKNKEEQNSDS